MTFKYRPTCELLAQEAEAESRDRMELLMTAFIYIGGFGCGVLATLIWTL